MCVVIFVAGLVSAHEVNNIFIQIGSEGEDAWSGMIHYDAGYALPEMRSDREEPQPEREWLVQQDEEQWSKLREGAEAYLRECLVFTVDGRELDWGVGFPDFDDSPPIFPRMIDGFAYFRVHLHGRVPVGKLRMMVRDGDWPSFTVQRTRSDEFTVVFPGESIVLMERHRERGVLEMGGEPWFRRAYGFAELGFRHVIPDGLDHVLFILALFFLSAHWRPLLVQSLLFTLAHSVTLALAVTGVVCVSADVVEPLVALSIVFVAFENLFASKVGRWRLLVVFSFGLIHGLGFAGALGEKLPGEGAWMIPLVMANLGVEIAQVSLLLVMLLVFSWTRCEKYQKFSYGVSAVIGVVGLWWFVDRIC